MIDTDTAEQILQGDDTHPDILQALGLELLAEVKRLKKELAHYTDNCTVVWMPDDVLSLDDTLTDEQVSKVLRRVEHYHDACLGISWDTVEFWISEVKKND